MIPGAWVCIGIDGLIKWRSRAFGAECGSGVFTRAAEVRQDRKTFSGIKREISNAGPGTFKLRESNPPNGMKCVSRKVPVTAEEATGALPEIGNDHDIGLVISRAGFDPCLPFAHVVGCSQVCVPVLPPISKPRNLWIKKKLTTPAIASEPYTAEAPSFRMSM